MHESIVENSIATPVARSLNRTGDPAALVHVAGAPAPVAETAPSPRTDFCPPSPGGPGEGEGEGAGDGEGAGPVEGDGDGDGGGRVFGDGEGAVGAVLARVGDGEGETGGRTERGTGAVVPAVSLTPGFAATGGRALKREGVILVTITHQASAGSDTMSVTRYFQTPASA